MLQLEPSSSRVLEPSSSRVLELEIDQYDRARARTEIPTWRADLEHKNEARVKLELEKKLDEPIPNNQYSLRIGSFTPLPVINFLIQPPCFFNIL
jgi:hypothetical protein